MGVGHFGNKQYVESKKDVTTLPSSVTFIETIKEIPVEVIKYIDRPIEIIKEIPVEIIKEVKVIETQIIEKPIEIIKEVQVEVIKEIEVVKKEIVEIPTEILKEIIKIETQILEKVPMWCMIAMVLELTVIIGLLIK